MILLGKVAVVTGGAQGIGKEIAMSLAQEGADLIISGAGLPLKMPNIVIEDKTGDNKTKFVPIASSARGAKLIFNYWADHY